MRGRPNFDADEKTIEEIFLAFGGEIQEREGGIGGEQKGAAASSIFPRSPGDGASSSDRTPLLLEQFPDPKGDARREGVKNRNFYRAESSGNEKQREAEGRELAAVSHRMRIVGGTRPCWNLLEGSISRAATS